MRFFAAFGVLCFHVFPNWAKAHVAALPFFLKNLVLTGYIYVPFFYILSGFVLEFTYGPEANALDRKSFWKKRFARLAPVYYFSLLIGIWPAFFSMLKHQIAPLAAIMKVAYYGVFHIFFLATWNPETVILNNPSWSIGVEAFFYLLFPLAVIILPARGTPYLILSAIACVAIGAAIQLLPLHFHPELATWNGTQSRNFALEGGAAFWMEFLHTNPITHLPEFLLGIILARLRPGMEAFSRKLPCAFLIAGTVLFCAVIYRSEELPMLWLNSYLMMPAFGAVILGASLLPLHVPALLVLLGEASYSLYILHVPLRDLASAFKNRFLTEVNPGLLSFAFVAAMVGLSVLSYKWIELPGRKFILNKLSRGFF